MRAVSPEYMKLGCSNLLLWEVLLWCKENGNEIFDLQGGRKGVQFFKKSFSPLRGDFYTGSIIHNKKDYNKLVKLSNTTENHYFPKYRKNESN